MVPPKKSCPRSSRCFSTSSTPAHAGETLGDFCHRKGADDLLRLGRSIRGASRGLSVVVSLRETEHCLAARRFVMPCSSDMNPAAYKKSYHLAIINQDEP